MTLEMAPVLRILQILIQAPMLSIKMMIQITEQIWIGIIWKKAGLLTTVLMGQNLVIGTMITTVFQMKTTRYPLGYP